MINKCIHCGYKQDTKSKLGLITCSSCGLKTPNRVADIKKIKEAVK